MKNEKCNRTRISRKLKSNRLNCSRLARFSFAILETKTLCALHSNTPYRYLVVIFDLILPFDPSISAAPLLFALGMEQNRIESGRHSTSLVYFLCEIQKHLPNQTYSIEFALSLSVAFFILFYSLFFCLIYIPISFFIWKETRWWFLTHFKWKRFDSLKFISKYLPIINYV